MQMSALTRRGFLGAGAGGTVAALTTVGPAYAGAPDTAGETGRAVGAPPAVTVTSDDVRYGDLTARGYNGRFVGKPDSVRIVHTTEQVTAAVAEAVRDGARIAVRSGGHCLDGLVDDGQVRMLLDVSEMDAVYFDEERQAFAVEAGAQLGHVYRTLYLDWGVTIPGGTCPTVGVGGHVQGGGYGALCRQYGAVVDHLYGVEVVVVDGAGKARAVIATSDVDDPHRDLWWAHTGGGGGNFGVVTKYWFRTPGATGDPAGLLPRPPGALLKASVSWKWSDLTEEAFTRIVRNHGQWHTDNDGDGGPYASLNSVLLLHNAALGTVGLNVQVDGTLANAADLVDDYIGAVTVGVDVAHTRTRATGPWLKETLKNPYETGAYDRSKSKGAYLRRAYSEDQIAALYRRLSDPGYDGHASVLLYTYGGRANVPAPADTAMPQRDSVLKANFITYWADPADDARHVDWMRGLYKETYAATGGVPVIDGDSDGSYINYPDTDLKDPEWNASGTPWQTLYYKDNYPRLQRIKGEWDPGNVFHHALSITY
ncbi:FAD-linked oxidase [Streptomyces sp. TS71-3]|nr:FAD-linked oxidase [Streptomyces sp. TS71-3]GHJ39510.1 FAD-linked oxidase [Streptomyces sp. TS71-3]GHJ42656.1 FAD-linked oxidase [Streptomyces sp. TS71-3]